MTISKTEKMGAVSPLGVACILCVVRVCLLPVATARDCTNVVGGCSLSLSYKHSHAACNTVSTHMDMD